MKIKITKNTWYKITITIAIFWLADFILHFTGVGESNYYYTLKFVNSFLLAFIWYTIFESKQTYKKIVYSFIFGTWISFTYLISSYSGFVQFFGIGAYYSPPPFVIFGIFLSPFLWWIYHCLIFWLGIEIAQKLIEK